MRPVLLAREAIGLGKATLLRFFADKCTHLAAGVAYYVLLSLFPLAIFGVSILGILLTDDARRAGFIDDVILPRDTRRQLCRDLRMLRNKHMENPWKKHDNIPL